MFPQNNKNNSLKDGAEVFLKLWNVNESPILRDLTFSGRKSSRPSVVNFSFRLQPDGALPVHFPSPHLKFEV
jgi:hypothetical protein